MSDETAKELDRTGPISDDEARQILSRFNSSHWKNETERARYSIPADPRRDDDIRLDAYISQTRALRASLASATAALERIEDSGFAYRCQWCQANWVCRPSCPAMIARLVQGRQAHERRPPATPAAAPLPSVTVCEPWCGTVVSPAAAPKLNVEKFYRNGTDLRVFCTKDCRAADRPVAPQLPKETPADHSDCVACFGARNVCPGYRPSPTQGDAP